MVGEKRRCGPVEFRTLKYFLTVAREENITRAAALLHVSVDGLAKIRRRAYAKIADDMQG